MARRGSVLFFALCVCFASLTHAALPDARPAPADRRFNSTAVNALIDALRPRIADADLATLFSNAYPNTLDTTVQLFRAAEGPSDFPDAFVITGDIEALWLRDSANQLLTYAPLLASDAQLAALVCGLVRRHATALLVDPYANSFNKDASGAGHQDDIRVPKMRPEVFEGKYELDSIAAALKLAATYWESTGDAHCLFGDGVFLGGLDAALHVVRAMQATLPAEDGSGGPYSFERQTTVATDTLAQYGAGSSGRACGLSRSYFRPSDDAVTLPFHVPSNAMLAVEAKRVGALLHAALQVPGAVDPVRVNDQSRFPPRPYYVRNETWTLDSVAQLAEDFSSLAASTAAAVELEALVAAPRSSALSPGSQVFAYEVDGYGGAVFMDDANVPSLLSLPYLGFVSRDGPLWAAYEATRALLLSDRQPFFFRGSAAEGIGSPHTGPGNIWPMSLVMRALTSEDDAEIAACLRALVASSAGTGFLHESFFLNDPSRYTRSWFAWVNGLFGELVVKVATERPHLILRPGEGPFVLPA